MRAGCVRREGNVYVEVVEEEFEVEDRGGRHLETIAEERHERGVVVGRSGFLLVFFVI